MGKFVPTGCNAPNIGMMTPVCDEEHWPRLPGIKYLTRQVRKLGSF